MECASMRTKDRQSATGLLPRMEARPRKDGLVSYRYMHINGKAIPLGTDKQAAIRQVLQMNDEAPNRGTVNNLWQIYKDSVEWTELSVATQNDYLQCSKQLLRVFGAGSATDVTPALCARYLRIERKAAPVRANREMALMSNLMNLAVERGEISANPRKQVRSNKERPRKEAPEPQTLVDFLEWARKLPGQAQILSGMAEFAALTGNRRIEFLDLHWPQVGETEIRLMRSKQREKQVVEVIGISDALVTLLARLKLLATNDRLGAVFPTRNGNTYTEQGFKAMWSKLVKKSLTEGVIATRFTFHDLRAYYVTQHKIQRGALPDLHANPGTTARIYDRTKEVKRRSL